MNGRAPGSGMDRYLAPADAWSGRSLREPQVPAVVLPDLDSDAPDPDAGWVAPPRYRRADREDVSTLVSMVIGAVLGVVVWLAMERSGRWVYPLEGSDQVRWAADARAGALVFLFVAAFVGQAIHLAVFHRRLPRLFDPRNSAQVMARRYTLAAGIAFWLVPVLVLVAWPPATDTFGEPDGAITYTPWPIAVGLLLGILTSAAIWWVGAKRYRVPDPD